MILHFACPNCGAPMAYNITRGKLFCAHCDHEEPIGQDPEAWLTPDPKAEETEAADHMAEDVQGHVKKILICPNCGGTLQTGDKTCAVHCDFCDSELVVADRLQGDMRPSALLPFSLDRDKAVAAFKKWCHNGLFAPSGLTSPKNIKNLRPVYVPYWLYDITCDTDLDATATRVSVYVNGDTEYTETSFYDVQRGMTLSYDQVPYDASEEMDDSLMAKLQPYDFKKLTDFRMPYFAGFTVDQRDYESEELLPLVKHQVEGYMADQARSTIAGYSTDRVNRQTFDYKNIVRKYVFLPIWFISYRYLNKDYIFAMNGQTGKVIGTPPISKLKVTGWFAGIAAVIFAVLMLIGGVF